MHEFQQGKSRASKTSDRKIKGSYDVITHSKEVTLLDLLDRILNKGVYISGDIVISVADVDLLYVGLQVLITSVEKMEQLKGISMNFADQEPT